MASTSSYFPCTFDVFLNFRGEDTRRTIVSHLYAALDGKGINTFKDDQRLELGDHISDEIHRAIQVSDFAVVVLSENYATSKWCLMELQLIMESYKLGEIKVFPIFYGVDPSNLRHQQGSFSLGRYQDQVSVGTVLGWKEALNLISSLSGVDSRHCADEAMMVKGIVEDISRQLASMQQTPWDDVFGEEAEQVKPLLNLESHREVSMIGLWGMGGVRKTTIARYLYEQLGRQFPAHCFIENVDETCKEVNLRGVQQQFLCDILNTKQVRKITSLQLGAKLIQSRLANLKVFVVLDGVEKVEQLNALAKETSWFGQGSRIIITTRDKRLLDSCRVTTVHEVRCLESEESLKMLKHFAFEGGFPPDDSYEGLAIRASQLTQGLPFALKAFSLYLRGISSIEQWEDTLDKFETAPPGDIMNVLLRSYFSLDMRDQTIFLRVACLFNGEQICSVSALLSVPDASIKALADKSLIHISNDGYIDMHFLIQQMGRELVLKESNYIPQKQAILWDPLDSYHVLKRNTGTEKIEGMALHMCELPRESPINGSAFNQMHNLIFLKFFKHLDDIESKLDLISDNCILLPHCLRLLHWDAYPLTTLPPNLSLDCLVKVQLRYSNLESLWEGNPSLFELRMLDVTGSKNLTKLPNLSMAPKLEELIVKGCTRLEQIPETIGSLPLLKKLDVSLCDRLTNLQMNIGEWSAFHQRSPGIFRQVAVDFPDFVETLNSLTDISFQGKVNFWLPHLWGKAAHLSFRSEQRIPNELMTEGYKRSGITACYGFKSLDIKRLNYKNNGPPFQCYSFSKLPCLTDLTLTNLNIKSVPVDIGLLQELQKLDLSGNDFTYLPTEMENLSKMKSLVLCNCRKLQVVPQLTQLETLRLSDCTSLESLLDPSAVKKDGSRYLLQKIWLDNCKNVQRLSDTLRQCTNLTHLDLSRNNMVTMPTSIRYLRSLGTLCINDCTKLKLLSQIPPYLTYLYARGCTSLVTIYPLGPSLKHADLSYCPRLNGVEDLINQLLTSGEVSQCFACLPGRIGPSYFDNQATNFPQITHTSESVGFDACIKIACKSPYHLKLSSSSYSCKQEDNGSYRINLKPEFFIPSESTSSSNEVDAVSEHHMFVFHILGIVDVHGFRIESHLEFSEEFQVKPAMIISSRVQVIPKTLKRLTKSTT